MYGPAGSSITIDTLYIKSLSILAALFPVDNVTMFINYLLPVLINVSSVTPYN